jgi:hypothetical protein
MFEPGGVAKSTPAFGLLTVKNATIRLAAKEHEVHEAQRGTVANSLVGATPK